MNISSKKEKNIVMTLFSYIFAWKNLIKAYKNLIARIFYFLLYLTNLIMLVTNFYQSCLIVTE